ncbi:MAG: hypothetical protein QW828_06425, partial [Candidatus Bathyarchaeia archaeon]
MRKRTVSIVALVVSLMAINSLDAHMNSAMGQFDRAASLLEQARAALGGDSAISQIKNFYYTGKVRRILPEDKEVLANTKARFSLAEKSFTFSEQIGDGSSKVDTHIFIRREVEAPVAFKHGHPTGEDDSIVLKGDCSSKKIVVEKVVDGETKGEVKMRRVHVGNDGKIVTMEGVPLETKERIMLHHPQADFARRVLGILLQTPADFPLQYTYAGGVETADGNADVLDVTGPEGFKAKLYLNGVTHLPVMLSYTGVEPIVFIFKKAQDDAARMMMERPMPKEALIEVRFSDHRNVGGLMLPYHITRSVNGQVR